MKRIRTLTAAGLLSALALVPAATPSAMAQSAGRATPPPVILSPDLAEPWLLQLRPHGIQPPRPQPPQQSWFSFSSRQPAPVQLAHAEPARKAPQATRQIDPKFLPAVVDYTGPHKPGTIVVDTNTRYLYLVQAGGTARRYGIGVGKPGFEWAGTHKVTRKAEWPDWRPPASMRKRRPELLLPLLGEPGELDGREHLPDLHRRALHLAELAGDLDRDLADALVGLLLATILVAAEVRDSRPRPAEALLGDHPADARGAADTAGPDLRGLVLGHRLRQRAGSRKAWSPSGPSMPTAHPGPRFGYR